MKPALQTAAQFASFAMIAIMAIMLYKESPPLDVIPMSLGGAALMGLLGHQIGDILANPRGSRKKKPVAEPLPEVDTTTGDANAEPDATEQVNLDTAATIANQARQAGPSREDALKKAADLESMDDEAFLNEILSDSPDATQPV